MPKVIEGLRTIAPALSTALGVFGGPIGNAAGTILREILEVPAGGSIEESFAKATPEQIVAIKTAEQNFAIRMRELDLQEGKMGLDDIANARQKEIAMKGDLINQGTMVGLACAAIGLLVFLLYLLVHNTLDSSVRDFMLILVGSISAYVTQVFNYYFGSSAGSKTKTDHVLQKR